MHVVVIDHIDGDKATAALALAKALGKTAFDCRPLVNVPGGGPVVIACHAEPPEAEAMSARIQAAGFPARVFPSTVASPVRAYTARTFVLGETALGVQSRDGRGLELNYDDIEIIVQGSELSSESHTETKSTRKLSLGRAAITGGLIMTRKEKTKRTTTTTDSELLMVVYARSAPPVALLEGELQYQGLGAAMQPARMANFLYLAGQLRQRCRHATWDERLMRRATQQQILGSTLDAGEHLDLAIALIAVSERRARASGGRT